MRTTARTTATQSDNQGERTTLAMRGICKRFGLVTALDDVNLQVQAGRILALMGENGAGKSTLMKVLSGVYTADSGTIFIDGEPVDFHGPGDAIAAGISIIHQEIKLSPNLTVAENLCLGDEPRRGWWIDRAEMNRRAQDALKRLSCSFSPTTLVGSLSVAEQQQVEIARALQRNCRILVMDEPTAALSERESEALFTVIRQLRDQGLSIVYISHRMAEVYALADRVSVLRDGRHVGDLEADEIDAAKVVQLMVGRPLQSLYQKDTAARAGEIVLEVTAVADGDRIGPCSFHLRSGEVVGLAGLVGSGRSELAQLIFGARPLYAGEIRLEGEKIAIRSPLDAIRYGIGYVPEDRKQQGLFLDMSSRDNIAANIMNEEASWGWIHHRRINRRVDARINKLNIRLASRMTTAGVLSGGNQQKLLVARWMEITPRVLILDEPTRGVDIGAKSEIYRAIQSLAQNGVAVLMISSELPEIIALSDRILVMKDGYLADELPGGASQEDIMAVATHA